MNDYKTALKEYQELQFISNIKINDMAFLADKVNSFNNAFLSMKETIQLSLENTSEEFNFINPIFKNYLESINKLFLSYKEKIIVPLKISIETFNNTTQDNIKEFNKIKTSLIESKQKVTKAKEEYYNFIKSNKNNDTIKDDQNELFKAKKDNFAQLYKYEVDKMNEIINKNNKDYEKIINTLNEINLTTNNIIKNILCRFCKHISDIGNIFIKCSEQLNESLDKNLKDLDINKIYIPQIDKKTNLRFNLEIFEEYKENKAENKEDNVENLNINNEKSDNTEKKEGNENNKINGQNKDIYLKRIMSLPRKGFDDFEIIDGPIYEMTQERMKENINQLNEIIKKLTSEKELTPLEINQLINILKEDPLEKRETFSYIFLIQIKKFYKNRVINLKNRQNFIHLTNIMNNLCIKEDNTKTYNAIIEVSQMIKFENLFLFSMIQKKNHFFSTKTFWLRVIQDNLLDNINNYANKLLTQTANDRSKNRKKTKYKKDLLLNTALYKDIINYNKLYEDQINELNDYAYENLCIILSKTIPGMCSFLVPEFTSIDIINHYSKLFDFDSKTKNYFENLLEAKNIRNTSSLKKTTEKSIKKSAMFNIIFIISSTLKFLPRNEFINLLQLNKFLKPHIEKKIFKFLLSNKDLTIDKRIKLWENILNVKNAVHLVNYQNVKSLMKERLEKKEIEKKSQEGRNLDTIDKDLVRTPFISKHEKDKEKLGWVLKCLNYAKPDVGYCQGMNYLALFFYQLLDYDEEKTFNFMFALETQTKYEQLFHDDLRMLKIFFIVLDKLINLYKPEIYYKFVDSYLSTNIYSTPWFVTLFTNIGSEFHKKDYPKYVIMVMENYIIDGWSAIFNSGFTLTRYYFDKIMKIEEEKLINYMIKDICEEDIVQNENFEKIQKYYEKNSEKINEFLISKLIKITRYENINTFLKNKNY